MSFRYPVSVASEKMDPLEIPAGQTITITQSEGSIELKSGRFGIKDNYFNIIPVNTETALEYNRKRYKGQINLRVINSKILIVNVEYLEDYLKGVIQAEMGIASTEKDFEALKAFTICARNFALMKINENKSGFDVYGDTRDQVYAGVNREKDYIKRAVDATRSLVLIYQNELAKTFYSSSCGGHTEDCGNVFREKSVEYLRNKSDGQSANCSISPSFNWTEKIPYTEILRLLRIANLIGSEEYLIKKISVKSRFNSGRINELEIRLESYDKEVPIILHGNNIRYIIRSNNGLLKSTLCEVTTKDQNLIISGKGNGHGVGFCQWGALGQSRQGKSYEEILYFYFPGTRIENGALVSHLGGI